MTDSVPWYQPTLADDIVFYKCANTSGAIQQVLNDCRELRTPYVVITPAMKDVQALHRIIVPVSRLEEETYKAEICTYLARKTGAHIILLQANDYGSRARQNVGKIVTHIQAVAEKTGTSISYEVVQARKDSSKVNREAAERQRDFVADLIILTASREYGLDDLFFGPQERHVIQRALVPVMLVNPRDDLFSLCD
ncbi:MAG: universal stress protein [Paludibacteraceae bacterium]|nr:universal stress protein [Paludibacteraceae bacterium]